MANGRTFDEQIELALYDEFYKLRGDVRNVEMLRQSAERIMSEAPPERRTPTRTHDHDL